MTRKMTTEVKSLINLRCRYHVPWMDPYTPDEVVPEHIGFSHQSARAGGEGEGGGARKMGGFYSPRSCLFAALVTGEINLLGEKRFKVGEAVVRKAGGDARGRLFLGRYQYVGRFPAPSQACSTDGRSRKPIVVSRYDTKQKYTFVAHFAGSMCRAAPWLIHGCGLNPSCCLSGGLPLHCLVTVGVVVVVVVVVVRKGHRRDRPLVCEGEYVQFFCSSKCFRSTSWGAFGTKQETAAMITLLFFVVFGGVSGDNKQGPTSPVILLLTPQIYLLTYRHSCSICGSLLYTATW